VICDRCGKMAVWVKGIQANTRRCTCPCHQGVK
jgi:hypothetical protein